MLMRAGCKAAKQAAAEEGSGRDVVERTLRSSGLRSRSLHSRSTPAEQHEGLGRSAHMLQSGLGAARSSTSHPHNCCYQDLSDGHTPPPALAWPHQSQQPYMGRC